jgi:hypothetical protein
VVGFSYQIAVLFGVCHAEHYESSVSIEKRELTKWISVAITEKAL